MGRTKTRTVSTSSRPDGYDRHVSTAGHVLKLARESVAGLSQERLAEHLHVDVNTVQSWETGRRALTSIQLVTMKRLQHVLRRLGANEAALAALHDASEADYLLDYIFTTRPDELVPESHPLATWVMTRSVAYILGWVLADQVPAWLSSLPRPARRGPVADKPYLGTADREHCFNHLRVAAEKTLVKSLHDDPGATLLRWQAYYLSAWTRDGDGETRGWLADMERAEHRLIQDRISWPPAWAAARSLAVAEARLGDPEPLRRFIDHSISSDQGQAANLNYWAYWVGETSATHFGAEFIGRPYPDWGGSILLGRLIDNLRPSEALIDLYVHSLAALLRHRPHLLRQDPGHVSTLRDRADCLLSQAVPLTKAQRGGASADVLRSKRPCVMRAVSWSGKCPAQAGIIPTRD
jgi:transcriptional regulator with XRE-family HTH domain